jgi:hypothetical protein
MISLNIKDVVPLNKKKYPAAKQYTEIYIDWYYF